MDSWGPDPRTYSSKGIIVGTWPTIVEVSFENAGLAAYSDHCQQTRKQFAPCR